MGMTYEVGNDFELAPEGPHVGRCIKIIDLGTQHNIHWDKWQKKVMFTFELTNTAMEDGRPFIITNVYTASMHSKSNLRKDLESWRGKSFSDEAASSFDILNCLNVPAFLNIVHNTTGDNTYANIKAIMPLPRETVCPEPKNEIFFINLAEFNDDTFKKLSEKMQEKIMKCKEWENINRNIKTAAAGINKFEDVNSEPSDIPF